MFSALPLRADIAQCSRNVAIDIEGASTVLMVSLSLMPKRFEAGVSNDINRREALIGPANVATKSN